MKISWVPKANIDLISSDIWIARISEKRNDDVARFPVIPYESGSIRISEWPNIRIPLASSI